MTSYIEKIIISCLKHRNIKIFLILSARNFFFRVFTYILYVELYLKLTQYQLNVQLSSIYPKYFSLNQQFCKQRRWSICSKCNANLPCCLKPYTFYIFF